MSRNRDFFSFIAGKLMVLTGGAVLLIAVQASAARASGVSSVPDGTDRQAMPAPRPANLILRREASGFRQAAPQNTSAWQQITFHPLPSQKAKEILNAPEIKDLTHLNWEIDKKNGNRLIARLDKTGAKNLGNPSGPQIENMIPGAIVDDVEKGGATGLIKGAVGAASGLGGDFIPGVGKHIPNNTNSAGNKYLFSNPAIVLGPSPSGQRGPSEEQVAAIKKYADAIGHQLAGFPTDAQSLYVSANSGPSKASAVQVDRATEITRKLNIDTIIFVPAADGVGPIAADLTSAQAKYFTQYLDEGFNGGKGMTQKEFFGSEMFVYTPKASAPTLGAITGGTITVDPKVSDADIDALAKNRMIIKSLSDSGPEMANTMRSLQQQSQPKVEK